jgi:hypothetical protein
MLLRKPRGKASGSRLQALRRAVRQAHGKLRVNCRKDTSSGRTAVFVRRAAKPQLVRAARARLFSRRDTENAEKDTARAEPLDKLGV